MAGGEYWGERRGRVHVVPNVVPTDEIDAAPLADVRALGLRGDKPFVMYAGRLEPEKNIAVLMPALERVLQRHDVDVLWCGNGILRDAVASWVEARPASGRSRAVATGHVSNLWSLMKAAAVLISPSQFEGRPNVVLEGMACEVPLVVSAIPAHREILDESTAWLVPEIEVAPLARAIDEALTNPREARARAELARARVQRFSAATIAAAVCNGSSAKASTTTLATTVSRQFFLVQLKQWVAIGAATTVGATAITLGYNQFQPEKPPTTAAVPIPLQDDYRLAGFPDARVVHHFIAELQERAQKGDRASIAKMVRFPLPVHSRQGTLTLENEADLIARFDGIFGPAVVNIVLKCPRSGLYCDARGVMIGSGEVWLAPEETEPRIIALNLP